MAEINLLDEIFAILGVIKMRCERCQGKGRVVGKAKFWSHGKEFNECTEIGACPDCGGSGQAYCCDGEQAQPDPNTDVNPNEVG